MSAEERREAIVAAAVPLFAERGFDAVTTRDIAAAAGVSEALLYRHFASKQHIYEAIQTSCVAESAEPVERLRRMPDDTASLVTCIYVLMWKLQQGPEASRCKHTQIHRLVCRSLLTDGLFAAEFLRRTSEPWIVKIRSCLEAAIRAGDVVTPQDDAELGIWLGHHLSAMIEMYNLSGVDIIEYPGGTERLLERSVLFCLRGLGMTAAAIERHYHPDELAAAFS